MKCKYCNFDSKPGAKFCENCGSSLEDVSGGMNDISAAPTPSAPQMGNNPQNGFGQPSGFGQPNGFGQPSGFGQPNGYGQPNGFGQPYGYDDGHFNMTNDSPKYVEFAEAINLYFKNFFNFGGRSTRSEYWYSVLFVFLVSVGVGFVSVFIGESAGNFLRVVQAVALFIPSLSIQFRRLHDAGRSGVWSFVSIIALIMSVFASLAADSFHEILGIIAVGSMISLVFGIVLLVFCCMPSVGPNKWGKPAGFRRN